MSGLFGGGGNKISNSAPVIAGFRVQTSAYGRVIPRVFGKTRVAANLLWYGDFTPVPHTTVSGGSGGKGGGVPQQENTTYTYYAALLMMLCKGQITAVPRVWRDKEQTTLAALGLSLYTGTDVQNPFPHLATNHPADAFAYRGMAYVATASLFLGDDAQLRNHTFEIEGEAPFSVSIRDANPKDVAIAMIQEAGVSPEFIGDLTAFSNYCVANGIFISPAYTEQRPATEVLKALAQIGNSEVVLSEDKIKLVPYSDEAKTGNGATYTPDVTPVFEFNDDDFLENGDEAPVEFEDEDSSDAFNIVKVKIFNRDKDYAEDVIEVQDDDHIAIYGRRPMDQPITLNEINDPVVGRLVAQNILQHGLHFRLGYRFNLGFGRADLLEPMDVIALTNSHLSLQAVPVRVREIEELDNDQGFSFIVREFPAGAAQAAQYAVETGAGYNVNFNADPGDSGTPVIFDAPGALTVSGFELWMAVSGGADWGGAQVWVASDPGGPFKQVGTIYGPARHGELSATLGTGADPDTANTASVDLTVSRGSLTAGTEDDADKGNTLCLIGDELISYRDAELTAQYQYDLGGYLRRGVHGTPVSAHAAGETFVRLDQALFRYEYDPALVGQTVYIKLPSFNIFGAAQQTLDEVSAHTHVIRGSIGRPATPQGYTVSQNGIVAVFQWMKIEGAQNIRGFEIRYTPRLPGAATEADYENATPLTKATRGTQITTAKLPPGDWTTFLKAEDGSDKQSSIPARFDIVMESEFDLITVQQQAPDWLGTLTNMVRHHTGKIYPDSQDLASAGGWDTFDIFVPNPYPTCSYEAPEIDLGIDGPVRVWAETVAELGPGVVGRTDAPLSIDYKLAAGSYDGFEPWTIGTVPARYVKQRLDIDTTVGVLVLTAFNAVVDAEEREEIVEGIAVGGSGSLINFATPFHLVPSVFFENDSATPRLTTVTGLTATGFTGHIYNTSGSEVGGAGKYRARGV